MILGGHGLDLAHQFLDCVLLLRRFVLLWSSCLADLLSKPPLEVVGAGPALIEGADLISGVELRIVGAVSHLIASEATVFLDVSLSFREGEIDRANLDILGRLPFPPVVVAVHGVGELPLMVKFGCFGVPFFNGCWKRGVTVDLVSQSVVQTALEEGGLGEILREPGTSDQGAKGNDMFIS